MPRIHITKGSFAKAAGNKIKGAYGKLNSKTRNLQTYAARGDLKRDLTSLKNNVRRQTSVSSMKASLQQAGKGLRSKAGSAARSAVAGGRIARDSIRKAGKSLKGMGSRSKYAGGQSDGLLPNGQNGQRDYVNNSGSEYRTNPFAKDISIAGQMRSIKLKKTKGGGARINPNLGKVVGGTSQKGNRPKVNML